MYALTIQQPYASLIIMGFKTYETRPWVTPYRGGFLIHAGRQHTVGGDRIFTIPVVQDFFATQGIHHIDQLPHGSIIGSACLKECIPTEALYDPENTGLYIPANDLCVGDFRFNRYAFALTNPRPITPGIPATGKPGLWEFNHAHTSLALAARR